MFYHSLECNIHLMNQIEEECYFPARITKKARLPITDTL